MYGLVNKALRDLVLASRGLEEWTAICRKAAVVDDIFVGSEAYDDAITYRLIAAACEVTGTPPQALLRTFGEHWVLRTAREGYGGLMDTHGKTLGEFLQNLPNFHTRVSLMFPKLQPPRFEYRAITDYSCELHYRTHRPGLSEFVVGLIQGLGKMFNTPVRIDHTLRKDEGADHDVFVVDWSPVSRPAIP